MMKNHIKTKNRLSASLPGLFKKGSVILFIIAFLFSSIAAFIPASVSAEIPTFSNPNTLESDVRTVIQSAFNTMSGETAYRTSGLSAAKFILQTDESGEIIRPFNYTPFIIETFEHQLMDYDPANLNPYNQFAIASWGITIQLKWTEGPQDQITSMDITISYTIQWRDGVNALSTRNTVFSHVNGLLLSPVYTQAQTDDDKLKAINQLICESFQYDYRLFIEEEKEDVIYTAYKMIQDLPQADGHPIGGYPRGVCQAYAMYGYLMLRQAGYESITVTGQAGNGGHAWNMVKVGSNWYHIDFTWNDPISRNATDPPGFPEYPRRQNGEGVVSVNYLLRSDNEMEATHLWPEEYKGYNYPKANALWSGVPTYVPVTQENPAPTITQTPVSDPVIVLTPTKAPNPTPTKALVSPIPSSPSPESDLSGSPFSGPSNSTQDDESSADSEFGNSDSENPSSFAGSGIITITVMPTGITVTPGDQPEISSPKPTAVTIRGYLFDSTGNPLTGLILELFASSQTAITDSQGRYLFEDIQVGNYKIYVKDSDGNEIAELPVLISPGDRTEMTGGKITVRGGTLQMDLMLSGGELFIRNVSSPRFESVSTIVIAAILAGVFIVIAVTSLIMRKKGSAAADDYLDV